MAVAGDDQNASLAPLALAGCPMNFLVFEVSRGDCLNCSYLRLVGLSGKDAALAPLKTIVPWNGPNFGRS